MKSKSIIMLLLFTVFCFGTFIYTAEKNKSKTSKPAKPKAEKETKTKIKMYEEDGIMKVTQKNGKFVCIEYNVRRSDDIYHYEGNAKNYIVDGPFRELEVDNTGKVVSIYNEGEYKDGKKHGIWTWYNYKGEIDGEEEYENGKAIGYSYELENALYFCADPDEYLGKRIRIVAWIIGYDAQSKWITVIIPKGGGYDIETLIVDGSLLSYDTKRVLIRASYDDKISAMLYGTVVRKAGMGTVLCANRIKIGPYSGRIFK